MNNYYIKSIKHPFKNKVCINCGAIGTQLHHVVPKELGGNDSTNCVWLCDKCHGLVHNISYGKNQLSHSELINIYDDFLNEDIKECIKEFLAQDLENEKFKKINDEINYEEVLNLANEFNNNLINIKTANDPKLAIELLMIIHKMQ